jgi:hypothetical protein
MENARRPGRGPAPADIDIGEIRRAAVNAAASMPLRE